MAPHRLTPAVLALLLLPAAQATLRAQDFEGVVTVRIKDISGDSKLYVKGVQSRMEMTMQGMGSVAIIPNMTAGETYLVMPAQSMYMVMKMSDAEKLVESKIPGTGTTTATGRREKIAGYGCEIYRYLDAKSAMDMCLTSELGAFKLGASLFAGFRGPGRSAEPPAWAREMVRLGKVPLKIADTTGVPTFEVLSIEKGKLDAALFIPPANYQKMQMPSFGRPPLD